MSLTEKYIWCILMDKVLKLVDLNTLEISKDSFIEKDLAEYHSDILYKVKLTNGSQGFIYVLFEHKSYYDRFVHLQLLEYMVKIWRLYIKQHKKQPDFLPIVIPLLVCHARKEWPEDTVRLASLLSGPVDDLTAYIPNFGFELYDLHRYSDDQIKGTIASRVILLLLKHIRDPDFRQKLPGIFALMQALMKKETGLQWLEVVIRYLASALEEDELTWKQIKEIAEQAISKETGGYVMTLEEKVRNEGKQEGLVEGEQKGKLEGLKEGIELGITLKFPGDIDTVMAEVNKIDDLGTLKEIKETIKTAKDISEILALLK
ncbi:Rpn family recombination-promoting nuclease/putative transposase [Desulfotignum phosphitoxidans]|uniref:DNA polymerase beta domain-containing protein n=1 Tax=Desulfotignum phosphitoxidans DSM 13687 TaxID=1286635 RepID=S0G0E3_9BACT|nr:Rpn family recombination-promoting nuclease/putative transposase [Desulfotignum phosphitoxidans]EMS80848.1 DNA polymerase beta domain-containing protein [Desulfotignum phosphitoxidans DSM 13687]